MMCVQIHRTKCAVETIYFRDKKPIKARKRRKKNPENCFSVRLSVGGKKNRQKERRLLKGFNLALPATAGMNTLPPVSEFGAPFHSGGGCGDSSDYYGSAFAGLMNTTSITPRRNHMYSMQQFSSSQSSFSDTFGTIGRLGKIGSKLRNTSQKRRWGECSMKTNQLFFARMCDILVKLNLNLCELK